MKATLRGFRVLLQFAYRAAPRETSFFLLLALVLALVPPAYSFGAKLLVDAAVARDVQSGLRAALLLGLLGGVSILVLQYYLDLLFTVMEKAGAAADRRLMELVGGIAGLEHQERPDYIDQLQLLRGEGYRLAGLTNACAGLLRVVVGFAASAALLVRIQPVLLLLPLVGVVSMLLSKRTTDLQVRAEEATAESGRLQGHVFAMATSPTAGKEIRVFGLESELQRRHLTAADAVIRRRNRAGWQSSALQALDASVVGLAYAGAIAVVLLRALQGQATPGDVMLTVSLAGVMTGTVSMAVGFGTYLIAIMKTSRRYLWLEDYAQAVRPALPNPASAPSALRQGIDLQDLSFRYPGTERPVLNGVSLHLPAGQVVALVGENGAGKTTLVKLLCRFYEPEAGQYR